MPPAGEQIEKGQCMPCIYVCIVAFSIAAFFAGAWTDGIVSKRIMSDVRAKTEAVAQFQNSPEISPAVSPPSEPAIEIPVDPPASPTPPPPPLGPTPMPAQVKGPKQCTVSTYCGGKDRNDDGTGDDVMVRDAKCAETPTGTICKYGCAAGICKPQPGGVAQISVTPSRVHSGETVTVSWSAEGMIPDSCSVKNLSQMITDEWSGDSGSKTSSPIQERTPYLLTCSEPSGVPFTTSATVELLK